MTEPLEARAPERPRIRAWRLEVSAVESARWGSVPPEVRLRRALRALLRSHGLRVEAAEPMEGNG